VGPVESHRHPLCEDCWAGFADRGSAGSRRQDRLRQVLAGISGFWRRWWMDILD
jgi:hypothetical protein